MSAQVPPPAAPADELTGLEPEEAARRLATGGPNRLPQAQRRNFVHVAREILREPMFLLLIAAGGIYLLLGDAGEAGLLLGFVGIIITLTVFQERRTERVLEGLRELSAPRAWVLRGEQRQQIPASELVPGDLAYISEGQRVPADGVLLAANELSIDESLLTGESTPVHKFVTTAPPTRAYSGTLVVQGQGALRVDATGADAELGRIGATLAAVEEAPSPLQRETRHFVFQAAWVGGGLCVLVFVLYGLMRGDWFQGLLAGITLAMGILPQEFPVILTVFMALGARRIASAGVLTRRLNAIETLGQTRVLCVDKTGTLTRNQMQVHTLAARGRQVDVNAHTRSLDEDFHLLLEYAILASEIEPFDPMERAFHQLGGDCLKNTEHLRPDWTLTHEYELTPELLAMSHLWRAPERSDYPVASKGAPEAMADLCHLPELQRAQVLAEAAALAARGLRVLGVARARHQGPPWPPIQHDFAFEWLGLIGLADPLRPEVPAAVAQCHAAGVRVVMITGDAPATARAIAQAAGIPGDRVVNGDELARMNAADLGVCVGETRVFARITPQQKLRLVQAFKARGEVVAMTGDGVNDAPALRAAHIGIAMGQRGTEVAREAAALVLLNDDFAALPATMRLGRRIYDNLRRTVTYTIAVHIPMIGLTLLPIALGWPLLLLPAHIVFLELVIDPVCSVVFESEPGRPNLMQEPPRPLGTPLFSRHTLLRSLLQGFLLFAVALAVFGAALHLGVSAGAARAAGFIALVAGNIVLIFCNRARGAGVNRPLIGVIGACSAILALIICVAPLARLFGFAAPSLTLLIVALAAALPVWLLGRSAGGDQRA